MSKYDQVLTAADILQDNEDSHPSLKVARLVYSRKHLNWMFERGKIDQDAVHSESRYAIADRFLCSRIT